MGHHAARRDRDLTALPTLALRHAERARVLSGGSGTLGRQHGRRGLGTNRGGEHKPKAQHDGQPVAPFLVTPSGGRPARGSEHGLPRFLSVSILSSGPILAQLFWLLRIEAELTIGCFQECQWGGAGGSRVANSLDGG
jgi:hypothetical protein